MRISSLFAVALLATTSLCISVSSQAGQKKGGGGGGEQRQASPPRSGGNGGGGGQQRQVNAPPVHAQREQVRTPNFVPRTVPTQGTRQPAVEQPNITAPNHQTPRRTITPSAPAIQAHRQFTKTSAGRVYDNGLTLRKGTVVTAAWQKHYFPKGHSHFPAYRQNFVRGETFMSPFGFFFGVCVPYIAISECRIFPPSVVFIDVPVFNGPVCSGFSDVNDQNLFNDPTLNLEQPGLLNAVDNLTETFQGGNIDGLVSLIDPNTNIAIYLSGKYQYSLPANDYIDLSRDAIQSVNNVKFTLNYLHQRAPGVFSVGGTQTYRDPNGLIQTTWVSFVLQDISGNWTLTQVGTAPGHKARI